MMSKYADLLPKIFNYSLCDEEERQKRNILIFLVVITAVAGALYTTVYSLLGVYETNMPITVYVSFCILNLLQFFVLKHYPLFRTLQLIGILLFPTATHYFNGGFDQSSVVALAAMLSPLGALMFHSAKGAKLFFYLFIVMIGFSAIADFYLEIPRTDIPRSVKMLFFFFNITTITSISFFLLQKFLADSEKTKELLKGKNQELFAEKAKVELALIDLRAAQTQLVHAEKMASLGELTAGIAHEIQNPLNFVNNFSEVSNELIDEMTEELHKGDIAAAKAIAADIRQNLSKIAHHGKRADSIVKGMLQHSRSRTGQKELTDINALCDEYLRLSYHGLRAKDSSFNASFETHFDPSIGLISAVPQEVGRVLLNLLNNAFYAVNERSKMESFDRSVRTVNETSRSGVEGYIPKVLLKTEKQAAGVKIFVEDNGFGISDSVREKIFQPFFTTKPTGQGTGLGLSLSYDIVKAHGGELKVESEVGKGTIFGILLPI